jgi:glycerophosphoryl diester phosphodiesterase
MTGDPIPVPRGFRVIAHRGASGYAPENTMAAFRLAERMGVREFEFDLQLTRDGAMVVVHDTVLDRYGYAGRRVADMTLAEIRTLDMAAWFGDAAFQDERVLTADELFDAFGRRFIYHAEIKAPSPRLAADLATMIARRGIADITIVTSFDFDILAMFHALAPDQPTSWLVREGEFTETNVMRAEAAGFTQFCPRAADVSAAAVAAAKRHVGEVRAHGVRTRADAMRAVETGCDGMTINWPDWLAAFPE